MKTERILTALAVLALVLKIAGIAGANIILISSVAGLVLLYFPFGFYFFAPAKPHGHSVWVSAAAGMVLSIALYGLLFKLMRWPGAAVIEYAGLLTIGLSFVLYEQKLACAPSLQTYYSQLLKRSIIVTAISVLVLIIPNGLMNEIMPSHLEQLHRNYLRDTTDLDAKNRYENYKNSLHGR